MNTKIQIGSRPLGEGEPVYLVAELSANHNQDLEQAVRIIHAAKEAGADAVKLQTYTPDTITFRSTREEFRIKGGTAWDGRTLHELYGEAFTPWAWHPKLKQIAEDLGLGFFSTPFDATAVDFLESMQVPAYKVASFELVDIPLLEKIARTGKPMIISTGMATLAEIEEAIHAVSKAGANQLVLLKCTSAYPAAADQMNLRTIPEIRREFAVPVGLSDHSMGLVAPVAAVALGACLIEKHLTLSRSQKTPDSAFSLEPDEFRAMAHAVRTAEQALGSVYFGASPEEAGSLAFRRSLFVVKEMKRGEIFDPHNVHSIRPANGLHTRHLAEVIGRRARRDIEAGTPLNWELVEKA